MGKRSTYSYWIWLTAQDSRVYGTGIVWYDTATGIIEQTVTIGQPGDGPAELWVGGWIYTASLPGAYVEFELEQGEIEWTSGQIFDPGDWSGWWSWFEQTIPEDYGFVAGACREAMTSRPMGRVDWSSRVDSAFETVAPDLRREYRWTHRSS